MPSLLKNVGLITFIPAAMAFLTAVLAWALGEPENALAFGITACAATAIASLLYLTTRNRAQRHEIGILFRTAAASWLLFALISSLPLLISARMGMAPSELNDPVNCLFEGFSATTSCGLTIIANTADLPQSIQFWRSFCQWIGGLGVLATAIAILDLGPGTPALYHAETRTRTVGDLGIRRTGMLIWKIHFLLTSLIILSLGIAGMPWWEAVNHGMTSVGTGGFTMNGDGMGAYSRTIQAIVIVAMILGSISFVQLLRAIICGDLQVFRKDRNLRTFLLIIVAGAILTSAINSEHLAFDSVFIWVSALTTSGFSTVEPTLATPSAVLLLIAAMFVGALSGSTAGGLKTDRLIRLSRFFSQLSVGLFRKADLEDPEKWRKSPAAADPPIEDIGKPLTILLLWTSLSLAGGLLLSISSGNNQSIVATIFEAVSAIGCVGLSSGFTSHDLEVTPKLITCFLMWAGRIEIIPVLMLLRSLAPRSSI